MAKAHSYDLRLRVMDFLEQKKITIKDAAKTFQISRKTYY